MDAPALFLHLVHVDEEVQDLAASSKLNAEWSYLCLLFDRGRRWADLWLRENFDCLGRASTFDVEQLFVPVISHRLVFRSGFLARARANGWAAAIDDFRQQCLELAPVPGSEEDPLFEGPAPAAGTESR